VDDRKNSVRRLVHDSRGGGCWLHTEARNEEGQKDILSRPSPENTPMNLSRFGWGKEKGTGASGLGQCLAKKEERGGSRPLGAFCWFGCNNRRKPAAKALWRERPFFTIRFLDVRGERRGVEKARMLRVVRIAATRGGGWRNVVKRGKEGAEA